MADATIEQVRERAQELIDRAKTDPELLNQLQDNPQDTLRAAGFDEHGVEDLTRELSDVEAHARCTYTCDRWSCIATICGKVPLTN